MEQIINDIENKISNNQEFRRALARSNLLWFSRIYFGNYFFYKTADFQKEIYKELEDDNNKFLEIISFRGSGKTTISMLFYPIWAMITGKAHFIVLISDTFSQIKEHIYNIKTELENNSLLKKDFGPFNILENAKSEEWQKTSIIIPTYDTKIVGKSTGQKVRGIRYKQWRPDLVIIDDIEDVEMIRTKEQRDKTHRWLVGNVMPAGEAKKTKFILIGNLLHSDGVMSRIEKEIKDKIRDGKVLKIPLINDRNEIAWPDKFPNEEVIEEEKRKIGYNDSIGMRSWQREYLLRIVPEEGQVIKDDWIKYYDELPKDENIISKGTGVDLAISKKSTADYTAMVSGVMAVVNNKPTIYVMPNPVNERLSGFETTNKASIVSNILGNGTNTPLWVEDVAYQAMQIEAMQKAGLPAIGVKVSSDKRARLMTISSYIENGMVLFPKKGCEDLLIQLLNFGIEEHDDLVDAFVFLVYGLMTQYSQSPTITWF
ncbi:MAG TPA: phage terminase large subunit [bacterium]|nr:phage terminase large subunit [bacterium]